jgi:transposase InsO family protein
MGSGGCISRPSFNTYSSVAFAKVYTSKIPVTAADLLNGRALPFFENQGILVLRVLTDRGTEYCGAPDKHPYQLFLQINEIEHTKTKVKSHQTNGICERVHQTILNEFYRVVFRKKLTPQTGGIAKRSQ